MQNTTLPNEKYPQNNGCVAFIVCLGNVVDMIFRKKEITIRSLAAYVDAGIATCCIVQQCIRIENTSMFHARYTVVWCTIPFICIANLSCSGRLASHTASLSAIFCDGTFYVITATLCRSLVCICGTLSHACRVESQAACMCYDEGCIRCAQHVSLCFL